MASPVYPTPRDHTHFYEPSPRWNHYTVPIGGKLYTWGGRTQDFSDHSKRQLQSVIGFFDPYLELWEQTPTRGVPPAGMYNGACTVLRGSMYVCCGFDGNKYQSALHEFDSTSLQWRKLLDRNPSEGPMGKSGCQMVSYEGDKLALFGGFGIPTGPTQPGSRFIKSITLTDGSGWNNEFHLFHLKEGIWSSPPTTGDRPPPCSHFSFTGIDPHRAVLFGGLQPGGRVNDAYILDLQKMHWKKLSKSGDWPVGRSAHAACCINYGEQHPQLLVTGGMDKDLNTLSDAWLLDVDSGTWKKLNLPDGVQSRCYHTITAISLRPGLTEATTFGGSSKVIPGATDDEQSERSIAETTVLQFESIEVPSTGGGSPSREWVLVGVAHKRQLGSPDRLREKMVELQQRATATEKEMTTTDRATWAQGRMRLAERVGQVTESVAQVTDRRAEEAEKEVEALKRILRESQAREREFCVETEKSLQEASKRGQESERGKQEATRQREEAETNTSIVRARAGRAETQAKKAEHTIQTQNDQIRRQTQQIDTLTHQLESEGAQSGQLKQRLDTTEERLHSKEVEMRKQQHQMEMKELEVISLQYNLRGREEQVQKQQEEIRKQQNQFQSEKQALTSQIKSLEDSLEARKREMREVSSQTSEIPRLASLHHPDTTHVQVVEVQQKVEAADQAPELESLRRSRAEQEAKLLQLSQDIATYQQRDERRKQEEQLQQELQNREKSLEERVTKAEYLESVHTQQFDELIHARLELIEKDEEIRQLRSQQAQTTGKGAPVWDVGKGMEVFSQQYQMQEQIQEQHEHMQQQMEHITEVWKQVDQLQEVLMQRDAEIQDMHSQAQPKTTETTYTSPIGYLRGAEVVAQRSFPLTLQAHTFEWREYGFMLHVPERSLPPEMTQTTVDVRVSLSGQFVFPENSDLVSATYWLSCPHKFMKPIDVEFQHCAAITDPSHCSQLSFVITKCTQKELPYKFKELEGGTFSQHSLYGRISLTHFSGLAIGLKRPRKRPRLQPAPVPTTQMNHIMPFQPAMGDHTSSQIEAGETASGDLTLGDGKRGLGVQYCAQLFTNKRVNDWKIQLMVTKNLKACCSVTEREYSAVVTQALHTSRFILQFAEDAISPDIPRGGTVLPNGWEIILPYDPTIERHEVDRYSPKRSLRVPGCEFVLRWSLEGKPPVYLKHPIPLNGAKGDKYFTLYIPDPGAVSAVESSESELSSPSGSVSSPHAPQTGLSSQYRTLQSEPELSDLQNEIATKIPNMWYAVGIQLKLTHNDLCSWLAESPSDTKKLFGHVFTAWKERGTRDYSWATMIEVLKTPSVCQPRLEEELAKKLNH